MWFIKGSLNLFTAPRMGGAQNLLRLRHAPHERTFEFQSRLHGGSRGRRSAGQTVYSSPVFRLSELQKVNIHKVNI